MATNGFRPRRSGIKGVSEVRRLPRLGKIRLGVKKLSKGGKEYPSEVDYFVCPDEVKAAHGEEPKELPVMLPLNDVEAVFPQAYKWYGSSKGVRCSGDGESADRFNEDTGKWEERGCPCELLDQKKCSKRAHLMVVLPEVNMGGVYQIDTGSFHSIVDINSGMDYLMAVTKGRLSWVPMLLKRVPRETHNDGKKQTHYTLQLVMAPGTTIDQIEAYRGNKRREQYLLPEPVDENPAMDEGAIVVKDEEDDKPPKQEENPVLEAMRKTEELANEYVGEKYGLPLVSELAYQFGIKESSVDGYRKIYVSIKDRDEACVKAKEKVTADDGQEGLGF